MGKTRYRNYKTKLYNKKGGVRTFKTNTSWYDETDDLDKYNITEYIITKSKDILKSLKNISSKAVPRKFREANWKYQDNMQNKSLKKIYNSKVVREQPRTGRHWNKWRENLRSMIDKKIPQEHLKKILIYTRNNLRNYKNLLEYKILFARYIRLITKTTNEKDLYEIKKQAESDGIDKLLNKKLNKEFINYTDMNLLKAYNNAVKKLKLIKESSYYKDGELINI